MRTVSYTALRGNLAHEMDRVNKDHTQLTVTRKSGKDCVLMSLEDYRSYEETALLMKSSKNVKRINEAISQLESGKGTEHKLAK